eukprot:COSAG02_NODE_608_length_19607_cov_201.543059_4_plen_427_part_00
MNSPFAVTCIACSCVPIDPGNPARYLAPEARDSGTNDGDTITAHRHNQHQPSSSQPDVDDSGFGSMSETMKDGFEWLVESSDEEEAEAEFKRQLARVEAEAAKPPPTVTKQYLDVNRRRALPGHTSECGEVDGGSSMSTLNLSSASTAGAANISVDISTVGNSQTTTGGGGVLGSSVDALPRPRAKRRWQRADNQLQGYFTSLMASEQLAEPDVRVRRNIGSRENRYRDRIRRTTKPTGKGATTLVQTEARDSAAAALATTIATGGGVQFDNVMSSNQPRRMLAFENITRRVQRTMEDSKYLEKQRLVREQTTRTNRKKLEDGTGFGAAMGGSRTSTRSLVPVRPVDKDPSVLGLPIRFCGSNRSGLAKESKTRGRRGRKIGHSGQQKVAVRGDDNGGDEALQNYSPLKYKVVGAAGKQQLELPPI